MIRLALCTDDPAVRARLEQLFSASWSLKRALQRDARDRVDAYWAAPNRRAADAKAWRERLGLSRAGLESAASAHLDASGHLKHHLTKALALHQADEVWAGVERHLFGDTNGKRAGRPRVGSWWTHTRIPGRARSHTTPHKWETFRLYGSLAAHLAAYPHPDLTKGDVVTGLRAETGSTVAGETAGGALVDAELSRPVGASVLAQPRRLPTPTGSRTGADRTGDGGNRGARRASWWTYDGPLMVVFTGGATSTAPDLVIPVRLPQGAGRLPYLAHYLADPARWHKIDLVRRADPGVRGGWRYEAHLMILGAGYTSPRTRERRAHAAGLERLGGVDGNVSNLAVVSAPATWPKPAVTEPAPAATEPDGLAAKGRGPGAPTMGRTARTSEPARLATSAEPGGTVKPSGVTGTRLTLTDAERAVAARARAKAKGRKRALDRSRRAANPTRYQPSPRQAERARRRADRGLPAKTISLPGGPRDATAGGIPRQAYRTDTLSRGYRKVRARLSAEAAGQSEARRARAAHLAVSIVASHGAHLVVEDCDISTWHRLWGRACAAFTPGMLITALARECAAAGGALLRASTTHTAMSQHCLCGARVPKSLADRVHTCPACGLSGDRDLISAALASCVTLVDPADPHTARVDYQRAQALTTAFSQGLQEALTESTVISPAPAPPAGTGQTAASPRPCRPRRYQTRTASARQSSGMGDTPTPDETTTASSGRGPHRTDVITNRTIPIRDGS
ncbi:zinc ribbon domain-containing protein [Nonomuraea helvata]|uniref:Cas12f1-like TNB domain-containing protein n=1 Tax=Nonomuraea helvata TaxID=37484 RepID=A0ABV5RV39_9ACTN